MEYAVDTETANRFHSETPLTTNHRHASASDRGWPRFFPEQTNTRRANPVMIPDYNFHYNHQRSGDSSASDSDDALSLYRRPNTLSYRHTHHFPARQAQSQPLPPHRPSHSSNSSVSSSTLTSTPVHVPSTSSATGRKVAANLQLFKETTLDLSRVSRTDRSRSRPPTSKPETPQIASPNEGEEVGETRFVRRTAWPDREAAAIRRGKSTISLKRVKTRDSDALLSSHDGDTSREVAADAPPRNQRAPSMHDDLIHDLVEWRPQTLDRGRAREREPPVIFPSQSSQLTPSISPIRERRSAFRPRLGSRRSVRSSVAFQGLPPSPNALKRTRRGSSATRASPVLLTNHLAPPPSVAPLQDASVFPALESSWSTDDESAWDTTSIASSLATTTSPFATQDELPDLSTTPFGTRGHRFPDTSSLDEEDEASYGTLDELDFSTALLPNVPLKPFKNQVGGHSAIYRFTKRAVCKVRTFFIASQALCF
jgi:inositol-hexakisphosphate kinase